MKYIPSIAFEEMSGSAKGVTAAKVRGRKYIRNRGYGGGVRTTAQAAVKSIFKQLSQSWKNLTNAQILAWNSLAQTQAGKSVLGTSAKISGANLYSRLNFWIVKCGGEALATPPTLVGVEAPAEADLDLSAEAFQFQLTDMPENVADLRLIIQASAPQSNGVTRAYGKAVQIGEAREVVDAMIDLKADYEAVHGAVTEAAPKVFLKYFFVNTKTGEKSGEMLASVKLPFSNGQGSQTPVTPEQGGSGSDEGTGDDSDAGSGVEMVSIYTSVNDKTMGSVEGMGEYEKGESVTLTAIPNEGYRFVNWGDGDTSNPRVVVAELSGMTYSAVFEADE